jgi:Caspase domain
MDGTRSALIVASDSYTDPGLRRLRAPAQDAQALAAVLSSPDIGGFDARVLRNEPAHEITLAVEEFFADRRPDDLLLLHFSCHGVKDEGGELYFAAANTKLRRLGATAVAAEFVNRRMSRSRSRRVVLLLDCCYAGAFERGMTARAGAGMDIEEQFGGRGRAVITASSAMEYAFEGDEVADISQQAPSVFTSALVEGLETGEADRDQDGVVALDELYDYVYDRVRAATPNQTPGKWTFGVQGELVIARRAHPVTTPAPLPPELQEAVNSPFAGIRAGAVPELARLLNSRHAGLALAARSALERLVNDDSRATSAAATEALAAQPPLESPLAEAPPAAAKVPEPVPAEVRAPEPVPAEPPRSEQMTAPDPAPTEPPTAAAGAVAPRATEPARRAPQAEPTPTPAPPAQRAPEAEPKPAPSPTQGAPGLEPEPAARATVAPPATGAGDRGTGGREELPFWVAGSLAIAGAVLLVVGLFLDFQWEERLFDLAGKPVEYFPRYAGLLAPLVLGAGACLLTPTRRLLGSGLLLGAAASSTTGLLTLVLYPMDGYGGFGLGYRVLVAAHLVLLLAASVAGVALARSGAPHLRRGAPLGQLPWLMILLAAAGALALLVHVVQIGGTTDYPRRWVAYSVWLTVLVAALPVVAALVLPRLLGAALLLGWAGGAAAIFLDLFTYAYQQAVAGNLDIGRTWILLWGLTLLPLLVVGVLYARADRSA